MFAPSSSAGLPRASCRAANRNSVAASRRAWAAASRWQCSRYGSCFWGRCWGKLVVSVIGLTIMFLLFSSPAAYQVGLLFALGALPQQLRQLHTVERRQLRQMRLGGARFAVLPVPDSHAADPQGAGRVVLGYASRAGICQPFAQRLAR